VTRDASHRSNRHKTAVRVVVGCGLGAIALWLTLRGIDADALAGALARAGVPGVLASLALVAATVATAVWRWRFLLFPRGAPPGADRRVAAAVVAAQAINIVMPIRLGEAARAFWISRSERQPLARVAATIVVERTADVVMLGVSISLLLVQLSLPSWARNPGRFALAASVMALGASIALARWASPILAALERAVRPVLTEGARRFVVRHAGEAAREFTTLGSWRSSAPVWILTALLVVLASATNYVLFLAFDIRLSPAVALLLFVVLQIGVAPASTPGNLGVFHYLTVLALEAFGVERTVAVAYAIVLHAVATLPKIAAGALIAAASPDMFLDALHRRDASRLAPAAAGDRVADHG